MPNLDNGQWVDENHPLYKDEQANKSKAQAPGLTPQQEPEMLRAQPPGLQPSTDYASIYKNAFGQDATKEQLDFFNQSTDPTGMTAHINAEGAKTGYTPTPTTIDNGGVAKIDPNAGGPDYASIYKQAFGTDATPDQIAWFNTQDPTAMVAHIQGKGAQQNPQPGSTYVPANSAPGTPGATPVNTQGKNASTYSSTPGAAPTASTTNQGTQDVFRNKLIEQATQSTTVDPNDPAIRNQADAFRAQAVRAARDLQGDQAVAAGPTGAQFARGQQRATGEKAAQAAAGMEAQLIGNEIKAKRDEIQNALNSLGDAITNDQRMALEKQLQQMNLEMQKYGIDTGAATAASELALKDKLGTGGLNVDLMRALLQNQQFGDNLGFNIADREAFYNNQSLQNLL